MPSQYNGIPENSTRPLTLSVASATSATPIVLGTGSAHGRTTGDAVDVTGVQGNTAANGRWIVVVVDSTHVQLLTLGGSNSVGNGAYTAGGVVQPLGFAATYQIPSDGDADNAAAFNVAYEALGDRSAQLAKNFAPGGYNIFTGGNSLVNNDDTFGQYTNLVFGSTGAWAPVQKTGTTINLAIPGVNSGDFIVVHLSGNVASSGASGTLMSLFVSGYPPGGSFGGGSATTPAKVQGTGRIIPVSSTYSEFVLTVAGTFATFPAGLSGGTAGFGLYALSLANPNTLALYGDLLWDYVVYRPNSP
jgi:hypothetical protein